MALFAQNGPSAKVFDIKLSIALRDIQFFNKLERFTLVDPVKFSSVCILSRCVRAEEHLLCSSYDYRW